MHPVIKIVSLIILSIFSTQGGWSNLFLTISIILPFYALHPDLFPSALQMTLKLKWLFLSILLIYFLFTPEVSYFLSGLFRVLVLISIVFSVNLFLKTSTIEQILESLLWIFYPLGYFNINVKRLSLRAVLTLEYIVILEQRLKKYQQNSRQEKQKKEYKKGLKSFFLFRKERLFQLIEDFAIIFHESLSKVEKESNKQYTIDCIEPPGVIQLLIPVLLCLLYIFNPLSTMNF